MIIKSILSVFSMSCDPCQLSYITNGSRYDSTFIQELSKIGDFFYSSTNRSNIVNSTSSVGIKDAFCSFTSMIGTDIEDSNGNILPISNVGIVG